VILGAAYFTLLQYANALAIVATYSKVISYIAFIVILCKDSIEINYKTYNNLQQ
jgi:hypothetical protein